MYLSPCGVTSTDVLMCWCAIVLLQLTIAGVWKVPGIAGAAALAVDTVNADKTVLPRMKARPSLDTRCSKEDNTKLKACDKDGDGGVNGTQGPCTLDKCKAICEVHTGFKCRYSLRLVAADFLSEQPSF